MFWKNISIYVFVWFSIIHLVDICLFLDSGKVSLHIWIYTILWMGSQGDKCTVTWLICIITLSFKRMYYEKKKIAPRKLFIKRERKAMEPTGFKTYLPYKEMIFNIWNITSMTNCFIFLIRLWIENCHYGIGI